LDRSLAPDEGPPGCVDGVALGQEKPAGPDQEQDTDSEGDEDSGQGELPPSGP
jgi:hypothetical protein